MGRYWVGTASDLATRMGVSKSTAYRWLNRGKLGAIKVDRRCVKCMRSGVQPRCDLCQIGRR